MKIVLISSESQKQELLGSGTVGMQNISFLQDINDSKDLHEAEVIIDLLFEGSRERIDILKTFLPKVIIINSVVQTLTDTNTSFVRINGWPGFMEKEIIEASGKNEIQARINEVFALFKKKVEWVPDTAGMVSPRVISMIINEAYLSYEQGVSSKEDINTAMKLGTNYPYGPFEWAERIGIHNISALLLRLAEKNSRYTPAESLKN